MHEKHLLLAIEIVMFNSVLAERVWGEGGRLSGYAYIIMWVSFEGVYLAVVVSNTLCLNSQHKYYHNLEGGQPDNIPLNVATCGEYLWSHVEYLWSQSQCCLGNW